VNASVRRLRRLWFPLIYPLLCVAVLVAGAVVGYAGWGKGDPGDVFRWQTWKHLFDLVFAD